MFESLPLVFVRVETKEFVLHERNLCGRGKEEKVWF